MRSSRRLSLMFALLVVAPLAGGCLSPASLTCGDGHICPVGTRCDDVKKTCVAPSEAAVCDGHPDGDDCVLSQAPGKCSSGFCRPFYCGDRVKNGGEQCDAADLGGQTCAGLKFYGQTTGLACNADCTFNTSGCTGTCGDLQINGSEACEGVPFDRTCLDLGYDRGFLGCSSTCGLQFDSCERFDTWTMVALSSIGQPTTAAADDSGFLASIPDGIPPGGTPPPPMPVPQFFTGVWGSDVGDVFAVGTNGAIAHSDGGDRWRYLVSPSQSAAVLRAIWGSGPRDVFAVGDNGTILHYDGASWSPQSSGVTGFITSVSGSGPNDVYAVGGGPILHYDGTGWNVTATYLQSFNAVWVSGDGQAFVAGTETTPPTNMMDGSYDGIVLRWDGLQWSESLRVPAEMLSLIWGSDSNDVFVGSNTETAATPTATVIRHWDGNAWSITASYEARPLGGIAGHAHDDAYTFDSPGISHWDGRSWSSIKTLTGINAVWAGAGEVFAVGDDGIYHWRGTRWGPADAGATLPALNAVWAASADDAFAVGDGHLVAHWDGVRWSTVTVADAVVPAGSLAGVWGTGPHDVLAVGAGGTILHFDGTGWSRMDSGTSVDLEGVWADRPDDAFAVGGTTSDQPSTILRFDGTRWSPMTMSRLGKLGRVWGSGPNDVYAVPLLDALTIDSVFHWNGTSWSQEPINQSGAPIAIWGTGANNVYAVGPSTDPSTFQFFGIVARWNGASWQPFGAPAASLGSAAQLVYSNVAGSGAGDVFITTDTSLQHLRSLTGTWEQIKTPFSGTMRGLSVTPTRVFIVGAFGESHLDRPSVTCVGSERDCDDGWDNDCDGLVDAADPDCVGKVAERCANGIDDDGDGLADCLDTDCAGYPGCKKLPTK